MVAIVAGSGLGLFNVSLNTLGGAGVLGQSVLGQGGGRSYVNAANGNLVLQMQDELLSGRGLDLQHVRTYNSQGLLDDSDQDGWRWGYEQTVRLSAGSVNQANSQVIRTDGDGHETTYAFNGSRYVSTEGGGAHDTLTYSATTQQWTWVEGSSRIQEMYSNSTSSSMIGRLIGRADTSGNSITLSYDGGGRLIGVKDTASQQELKLTYAQFGGVTRLQKIETRVVSDEGTLSGYIKQVEYGYTNGRLTLVKTDLTPGNIADDADPARSYITNYTYNATGRVESMVQSDGTSVFFTYHGDGRIATVKNSSNATSNQLSFVYTTGQTIVTDGNGQAWTYKYDAAQQLTEVLTPGVNGTQLSTKFEYDTSGNVRKVTDARNNAVTYEYDSNGNRTLERDALGNTVTRTYDSANQLVTETRYKTPDADLAGPGLPGGALTTRYVYDSNRRLRYVVSAEGRVTENRYDNSGNGHGLLTHTLEYTGSVYDVSGLGDTVVLSESDLNSWVTGLTDKAKVQIVQFDYDLRGNLGRKTHYATVEAGGMGVLDAAATVIEHIYDPHGQLLQTVAVRGSERDQRAILTSFTYDGMGRELTSTSSSGNRTAIYDGINRYIQVSTTAGLVETRSYDARGRLISISETGDGATRVTKYVYDNSDRLRMVEDSQGNRRFSFYDAAGRLTFSVDGAGAVTRYEYNPTGQVTTQTQFATRVAQQAMTGWYSATSNAVTKLSLTVGGVGSDVVIDAANDRVTTFGYDDAGRLETTTDAANVVTITKYDGLSRVTLTQTGDRVTRNLYDKDSLLVGTVDALGYLTEYKYDAGGQLIETLRYSTRSPAAANMAAPVWIGVTNQTAVGGQAFEYRVPAYDADGDNLAYSVVGMLPSWLTLDTSSATPVLRGTPPAASSSYAVTLRADDSRGKTTDVTFTIAVANTAPSWGELPDVSAILDDTNSIEVTVPAASDAESPAGLTYSTRSILPAGLTFNAVQLKFSGHNVRPGTYTITMQVTDVQGLSVERSFTLTVNESSSPAYRKQWAAVQMQELWIGRPFSIKLPAAQDPQGQPLVYDTVGTLPSWLHFDSNALVLSVTGTIPATTAFQTVELKASNASGEVRLSFGLKVRSDGPSWAALPPLNAVVNSTVNQVMPAATGQSLTYTVVSGLPPGLSFNTATRTITGSSNAVGFYTIVLRATDANGQSVDRTVAVQIRSAAVVPAQVPGNDQLAAWRPADPSGLRSYIYYDGLGRAVGSVDEQGFLSEIIQDEQLNTQRTLRYLTPVTVSAGDTLETVKSRAGISQQISFVRYDGFGRVSELTDLDGSTKTRNEYDGAGRLVRVITAADTDEQRASRTRYNAFGEVTGTLGGKGDSTLPTNPSQSQIDSAIAGYGMRYEHDSLGRMVRSIDANGNKTLFYYDRESRLSHTVQVIVQTGNTLAGEVSETVYNAFGQVESTRRYADRFSHVTMQQLLANGGGGLADQAFLSSAQALQNTNDQLTTYEYDRRGLLIRQADGENGITANSYNAHGQIAAQVRTILQGRTTTTQLDYDLRGMLLSQTGDVGGINFHTRNLYDAFGRVIRAVDGAGKITATSYQDSGRTIVITDPLNCGVRTEYDAFGRVLKVIDATGQATLYDYDDAGRSITVTTPEGVMVTTTSNRHGETLEVADGRGHSTTYSYDKDGQLKTITDALDQVITDNEYDNSGRLRRSTDARGTVTEFWYDQLNRVIERRVDPTGLNLKTRYAFNALGQQVQVTEGAGSAAERVTSYTFDRNGRLKQVTVDPNGLKLSTRYHYDDLGGTIRIEQGTLTQPKQQVTLYELDAMGRRVKEIAAPSSEFGTGAPGTRDLTTQYRYDSAGRVSRRIDANGQSTWYVYDAAGQQTHVINALGEISESRYDANGRLIHTRRYFNRLSAGIVAGFGDVVRSRSAPGDQVSTFAPPATHLYDQRGYTVYDNDGRVRFTVRADNGTNTTAWTISEIRLDANGNVIEARRYDKWLLDERINALDSATSPGISVEEMQTELGGTLGYSDSDAATLARVQRTRFAYDASNRLRFTVDALGSVSESVYDKAGNVVSTVRFAVRPQLSAYTESAIDTAIDAANLRSDANNQVGHFAYDAAGRQVYSIRVLSPGASGQHLVSRQEYDALGRTVKVTTFAAAVGLTQFTKQALDAATASELANPQNRTTASVYDAAGRRVYGVQVLANDQHVISKLEYDALGRMIGSTAYSKLMALPDFDRATLDAETGDAGNLDPQLDRTTAFVYDSAGRRRFVIGADGSVTETVYDALGQAIETRHFEILVASNIERTEAGLSEWRGSRTVGDGGTRGEKYTYDRAGRVLTTTNAMGFVETNVYNGLGDRTSYTDKKGATWTYVYDRVGRVFRQISPAVLMKLSTDGLNDPPTLRAREDRFYYDAFGNMTDKAEGINFEADRRTTRYNYDTLGRLTMTTLSGYYDPSTGKVEKDLAPGRFRREIGITYDALGNAVRTQTRTSATTYQYEYKTYDTLGRVVHDMDALSHVTAFTYTSFGEQKTVTRHGVTITGTPGNTPQFRHSSYWTAGEIAAKISGDAEARTITTSYDNLGRKTEVKQPPVQSYYFSSGVPAVLAGGVTPVSGQAITKYEYTTFGEVHRERAQIDADNWRDTWHYYDRVGREIHTVEELLKPFEPGYPGTGYHTTKSYDAHGNLTRTVEYATLGFAGASGVFTAPATPGESVDDRITGFTYDELNRRVSVQRYGLRYTVWRPFPSPGAYVEVAKGRNEGTTVQSTQYDQVGNILRQIQHVDDGFANWTMMEYDALNQLTKIIEPSRWTASIFSTVDPFLQQVTTNPETRLTLDAFGNVVMTERGPGPYNGAGATLVTRQSYDHAGNLVSTMDARQNAKHRKVDYAGRVIEETQAVSATFSPGGGYSHTLQRRYAYDASGRQTTVTDVYLQGATAMQSGQLSVFNAFGEITEERRVWGEAGAALNSLDDAIVASYSYDNAGHLIGKMAGDGATRYFYNLAGQVTRQEQRGNDSAADGTVTRITETAYDRLGRATLQLLPMFSATFHYAPALGGTQQKPITPVIKQSFDRWGNVVSSGHGGYVDNATNTYADVDTIKLYKYNHDNKMTEERLMAGLVAYRADGSAYFPFVSHQLRYDLQGRVVQERDVADNSATPAVEQTVLRERSRWYDAAGQLTAEMDSTDVRTEYIYDIHGNRVGTKNSIGAVFVDTFDENGNVLSHSVLRSSADPDKPYVSGSGQIPVARELNRYAYDHANRRFSSTDIGTFAAAGTTSYTIFDERNLVRAHIKPGASDHPANRLRTNYDYDQLGNKTLQAEVPLNIITVSEQRWGYSEADYSVGRLLSSTVQDAASTLTTTYEYNDFGQVVYEDYPGVNTGRQYHYYDNGLQRQITAYSQVGVAGPAGGLDYQQTVQTSQYGYTAKGELTNESLVITGWRDVYGTGGTIHPQAITSINRTTKTFYDEAGRMTTVISMPSVANSADTLHSLDYKYDELGNIRNIYARYQQVGIPGIKTSDNWFTYDEEGRMTIADGVLENGQIKINTSQGTRITYDALGRRQTAEKYSRFNHTPSGTTNIHWQEYREERYQYNDLGQVEKIFQRLHCRQLSNGDPDSSGWWLLAEERTTDLRGYVTRRKVYGEVQTTAIVNGPDVEFVFNQPPLKTTIDSSYRDDGQLSSQTTTHHVDSSKNSHVTYEYDNTGKLAHHTVTTADFTDRYDYAYGLELGGRKEKTINAIRVSGGNTPVGWTTNFYDGLGQMVRQVIASNAENTSRLLAYDNEGRNVATSEFVADLSFGGQAGLPGEQANFYANGRQVGTLGSGTLKSARFSFAYTPIGATNPNPRSHTVGSGDTLASIAYGIYGDRSLWYLIADANSLAYGPQDDLPTTEIGKSYRIPSVANAQNNARTFKPYNPAEIIGNNVPSPLPPVPAEECTGAARVIASVVVVAISIAVQSVATAALTPFVGPVVAAGIGAAAGNLAGQATGWALKLNDGIDWGEVGEAGFKGLLGGLPGEAIKGTDLASRLARAGLQTTASELARGIDNDFADWRSPSGIGGSMFNVGMSLANGAWGKRLDDPKSYFKFSGAVSKLANAAYNPQSGWMFNDRSRDWTTIATQVTGAFTGVAVGAGIEYARAQLRGNDTAARVTSPQPLHARSAADGLDNFMLHIRREFGADAELVGNAPSGRSLAEVIVEGVPADYHSGSGRDFDRWWTRYQGWEAQQQRANVLWNEEERDILRNSLPLEVQARLAAEYGVPMSVKGEVIEIVDTKLSEERMQEIEAQEEEKHLANMFPVFEVYDPVAEFNKQRALRRQEIREEFQRMRESEEYQLNRDAEAAYRHKERNTPSPFIQDLNAARRTLGDVVWAIKNPEEARARREQAEGLRLLQQRKEEELDAMRRRAAHEAFLAASPEEQKKIAAGWAEQRRLQRRRMILSGSGVLKTMNSAGIVGMAGGISGGLVRLAGGGNFMDGYSRSVGVLAFGDAALGAFADRGAMRDRTALPDSYRAEIVPTPGVELLRTGQGALLGTTGIAPGGSIVNPTGCTTNCPAVGRSTDDLLSGGTWTPAPASGTTVIGAKYFGRPRYDEIFNARNKDGSPDWANNMLDMEAHMLGLGDGARAVVVGHRDSTAGHVYNLVNNRGRIHVIDGQTGSVTFLDDSRVERQFAGFSHLSLAQTGRLGFWISSGWFR